MTKDITAVHVCLLMAQTLLLIGSTQGFFNFSGKRARKFLRKTLSMFKRGHQDKSHLKHYYVVTLDKRKK